MNTPFNPGEEVTTEFHENCIGQTFVVARVHSANNCGSKFLVVAHLKGFPDREIKGVIIDEVNFGIDSAWFKKVQANDIHQ